MTVAEEIAFLQSAKAALIAKMSALQLQGVASVGEGGRSISVNLKSFQDQIEWYDKRLAQLGAPTGTIAEPFVVTSRLRP